MSTIRESAEQVEIQAKYDGYIERQHDEIAAQRAARDTHAARGSRLPHVRGLSIEVQQKLNQHARDLGQAARISGVTPAAISLLLVHCKRGFGRTRERRHDAGSASLPRGLDALGVSHAAADARQKLARLSRAAREVEPASTT